MVTRCVLFSCRSISHILHPVIRQFHKSIQRVPIKRLDESHLKVAVTRDVGHLSYPHGQIYFGHVVIATSFGATLSMRRNASFKRYSTNQASVRLSCLSQIKGLEDISCHHFLRLSNGTLQSLWKPRFRCPVKVFLRYRFLFSVFHGHYRRPECLDFDRQKMKLQKYSS